MSVYEYQTIDGRKNAFTLIGLIVIFTFADFMGAAYVFDDPLLIFYGFLFRLMIFIPYLWFASKLYYFLRYSNSMIILISLPSFVWAALTFNKAFGLFYTLIIVSFFVLGMLEIKYREKQKEYDYKKSAKELLKDYPKPMTVKCKNLLDRYEKKRKNSGKEDDRIISFIMQFIPPWSIFALPGIVGTFASMYLGFGGMVVGGMFATVIGCLIFIGATLDRYRYDYVFEEAQKILDEKANK